VIIMNDNSPTLVHVFTLSKKIKFNMVEEKVVTFGFSKDITIISHEQSTSQPCSGGGGSRGGQV